MQVIQWTGNNRANIKEFAGKQVEFDTAVIFGKIVETDPILKRDEFSNIRLSRGMWLGNDNGKIILAQY